MFPPVAVPNLPQKKPLLVLVSLNLLLTSVILEMLKARLEVVLMQPLLGLDLPGNLFMGSYHSLPTVVLV